MFQQREQSFHTSNCWRLPRSECIPFSRLWWDLFSWLVKSIRSDRMEIKLHRVTVSANGYEWQASLTWPSVRRAREGISLRCARRDEFQQVFLFFLYHWLDIHIYTSGFCEPLTNRLIGSVPRRCFHDGASGGNPIQIFWTKCPTRSMADQARQNPRDTTTFHLWRRAILGSID